MSTGTCTALAYAHLLVWYCNVMGTYGSW